jgi:hypothetical protein
MEGQNILDTINRIHGAVEARSPLMTKLQEAQFEWPRGAYTYFLPINKLNELVTEPSVKEELRDLLREVEDEALDYLATLICSTSKKLFTVLLYGFKSEAKVICRLLSYQVTDKDLPFTRIPFGQNPPNVTNPPWHVGRNKHGECDKADHSSCGIPCLKAWHQMDIQNLCKYQWLVLAPIFQSSSGEIPQLDLDDNTVLPFTEDDELNPIYFRGGGYGEVWPVRIHPGHQNLLHSTHPNV